MTPSVNKLRPNKTPRSGGKLEIVNDNNIGMLNRNKKDTF